ncbi:hypothetical protein ACFRAE_03105 [Sphingobacterium sp. HJSM2_6]|uniref:hypothetical protein n=1 Tax=Sphingobacterium sp. HJSM2_6 TaxID=3366264 RepID=UPI003BC08EF8
MTHILKSFSVLTLLLALLYGCKENAFDDIVYNGKNDILEFSILSENNGIYQDPDDESIQHLNFYKDAKGMIIDNKIIVLAPYYAKSWNGLKPSFKKSDRSIMYHHGEIQLNGQSEVDFSNPTTYTVVADNDESKDYIVEFYKEKPIFSFAILKEDNPNLSFDAEVEIDSSNRTIIVEFSLGTNLSSLIPRFVIPDDVEITLNGAPQTSGTSTVDFSTVVEYKVSMDDDYPETWKVLARTREPNPENDFLTFNFSTAKNPSLFADLIGEVDTVSHVVRVASYWTTGINPLSLVPNFTISKYAKNVSVNAVTQISDQTAANFASPIVYSITADDGQIQEWTVIFYKPSKFYIKDRYFRQLLKTHYADLMEGDSLLIEKAINNRLVGGTDWWGDGMRNKDDLPIGSFSGIEFFQAIPLLGIPGVQLGTNTLDLRKNTGLAEVVYWNSNIDTYNISGLPGTNGQFIINVTAGKTPGRIIAQNVKEILFRGPTAYILNYLDYRGLNVNNFNMGSTVSFASGSKVLMTKRRWDEWEQSANPCVALIKSSSNMTLELWNEAGTQVVETKRFN